MRRVITFALVMTLTYLSLGVFAPAQPMPGGGTTAARLTALASRPGLKVVHYAGYTIRVPASWPVYRLDRDPGRCVRYDRHAVYLGQPGANQQCPAHLVGRTATISIQAPGMGSGSPGPASPGSAPGGPVDIGPAIGTLPQVGGSVTRDAQDQEMHTSLADPGVSVTGTYTGDATGVLSILRSLRRAGGHRAAAAAAAGRGPRPGDGPVRGGPAVRDRARRAGPAPGGRPAGRADGAAPSPPCASRPAAPPGPQAPGPPAPGRRQAPRPPGTTRASTTAARHQARQHPGPQAPGPQAPGPQAPGPPAPGPQAPRPPAPRPQAPAARAPGPPAHAAPAPGAARVRQLQHPLAACDAGLAP